MPSRQEQKSQFTFSGFRLSKLFRVFRAALFGFCFAPLPTLHLSLRSCSCALSPVPVLSAQRLSRPQIASLLKQQPERPLLRPHLFSFIVPSIMGPFFFRPCFLWLVFCLLYLLPVLTPSPPRSKTVTMLIRRHPRNPLISALLRRSSDSWKNIRPGRFGRVGF